MASMEHQVTWKSTQGADVDINQSYLKLLKKEGRVKANGNIEKDPK